MKTIYFITGNEGKVAELQEKIRKKKFTILQKDLGYPEIQAESLEDVALYGAEYLQQHLNRPFILEDAGIFIEELDGFPGVYSKFVYFTIGLQGILTLMKDTTNRTAIFRSVYAYAEPDKKPILFIGECPGTITTKQKGTQGFGYDPIFQPTAKATTFAEMTLETKNTVSHRGKAIDNLIQYLEK